MRRERVPTNGDRRRRVVVLDDALDFVQDGWHYTAAAGETVVLTERYVAPGLGATPFWLIKSIAPVRRRWWKFWDRKRVADVPKVRLLKG